MEFDHEFYVTPGINGLQCVKEAEQEVILGRTARVHYHARFVEDGSRLQQCNSDCTMYVRVRETVSNGEGKA